MTVHLRSLSGTDIGLLHGTVVVMQVSLYAIAYPDHAATDRTTTRRIKHDACETASEVVRSLLLSACGTAAGSFPQTAVCKVLKNCRLPRSERRAVLSRLSAKRFRNAVTAQGNLYV